MKARTKSLLHGRLYKTLYELKNVDRALRQRGGAALRVGRRRSENEGMRRLVWRSEVRGERYGSSIETTAPSSAATTPEARSQRALTAFDLQDGGDERRPLELEAALTETRAMPES